MVYRLILSYVGTGYAGWQRQPNALAVQQVVEEAVGEIVDHRVAVVGAGRTDAGVHARGQAAHLELEREVDPSALVHGTNHHLPTDIRVLAADRVRDGFHARKSALAKEYRYRVSQAPVVSPLEAPFVVAVRHEIDIGRLSEATELLAGEHDFTAFALAGGSHGQPRRTILSAVWQRDGEELELRLVGDGFLRGMVRSVAGTLLEVARGKRAVGDFESLLSGRPRDEAGPTAPAHGLTLHEVLYEGDWEVG